VRVNLNEQINLIKEGVYGNRMSFNFDRSFYRGSDCHHRYYLDLQVQDMK